MTKIAGCTILLTGATGGFGREFTKQMLAKGGSLILTDTDKSKLTQLVDEAKQWPGEGKILDIIEANLSDNAGCESLFHTTKDAGHEVDILLNNAGVGLFGRMHEMPASKWETLMDVNLRAPMRLTTLFSPQFCTKMCGHIVFVSSLAGWYAPTGMAHYSASKFGLRGYSEGLRSDLKPFNVKVTTVYPFFSRTPILESERIGELSKDYGKFPAKLATDPVDVIREVIRGIESGKQQVFPDSMSKRTQLLKRMAPGFLDWFNGHMQRKLRKRST